MRIVMSNDNNLPSFLLLNEGRSLPNKGRGIPLSAHLVVEEMDGVFVEPEGERLQE